MLGELSGVGKIFIITGRTDMRRSIDGLMAIIRDTYEMDPYANALFLFCGRKKNTIKALHFDKDGFVLYLKRLDNGENKKVKKRINRYVLSVIHILVFVTADICGWHRYDKNECEQQMKLLQTVVDQQHAYIQAQNALVAEKDARMAEKDETISELRKLVDDLQSLKANLEETLRELRRQLFGTASEKTILKEKNTEEAVLAEEKESITVEAHTRGRKPKSKRDDLYGDLPVREVKIPLTDEHRRCQYCNGEMTTMTYTPIREEIRIIPAKVERIRLMQEVAICPECKKDGDGTVVKSTVYPSLLPHSPASASAVAYVIFDKCFMGMPYYRQELEMAQPGFKLPRETMANWFIYCAEHYFYPIYERVHEHLIKRDILHADETTCQVLREEGKRAESTSYMWIYLTGSDGLPPVILYDYAEGRAGKYAKDFLDGFTGLLQCDGYQFRSLIT